MKKFLSSILASATLSLLFPNAVYAASPMDAIWGAVGTVAEWVGNGLASFVTPLFAFLAMLIIYIVGTLLKLSANVFDALIQWTIVDFGGTLTTFGIMSGIEKVWSAFRDIANIVIIGMFVFVAIMTILGSQNYGVKKFIVRILLVAVLINFSLLFTKLAIDFSHITARQFYQGMKGVMAGDKATASGAGVISGAGGGAAGNGLGDQYGDVAGAFLTRAGLTSGFDTKDTLNSVASGAGGGMKGLMIMWSYALTMMAFMLGMIVSFLFASYILASRAILLIFLMLTSSLAFAAYLIPKYGESPKFGFTAWKDALIKNTLLAPLLMIFLWASLTILQPSKGTVTLDAFFTRPDLPANWGVLVAYLFAAGLLFLSIKFAANFAGSIPRFGFAAKIPGLGMVAGALLGAKLGRGVIGGSAAAARYGVDAAERKLRDAEWTRSSNVASSIATRLGSITKRDFNLMNTGLGKSIASTAGLKGRLATGGKPVGGFDGAIAKAAERYSKKATALGKDSEAAQAFVNQLREEMAKTSAGGSEAHDNHTEAERRLAAVEKEAKDNSSHRDMELANLRSKISSATPPAERQTLENQAKILERQKGILATAENDRIKQAQKDAKNARTTLDSIVTPEMIRNKLKERRPSMEYKGRDVEGRDRVEEKKSDLAASLASERTAGKIFKGFEKVFGTNFDPVANKKTMDKAEKALKESERDERIAERLARRQSKTSAPTLSAPAPATPPPTAPTPPPKP